MQLLGTTGSPNCSWFLCVPTITRLDTTPSLKQSCSPLEIQSREKKINSLGLTKAPKENGQQKSFFCAGIFLFLTAPGICPPLALFNKLALALLLGHLQPPSGAICMTKPPAQPWLQQWLRGHQEGSVQTKALPAHHHHSRCSPYINAWQTGV